MLTEEELADILRQAFMEDVPDLVHGADIPQLRDAVTDELVSENAGFQITLLDGTKFHVVITKVEEGQ